MVGKRMLHKNICISDKIVQLSWFEEVLYYRILVNADDHGMFFSTSGSVLELCFPRRKTCPRTSLPVEKTVGVGLARLVSIGLLEYKTLNERRVLHVKDWNEYQFLRSDRPKHSFFGIPSGIPDGMTVDMAKDKDKEEDKDKGSGLPVATPGVREFLKHFGALWKRHVGNGEKYNCQFKKDTQLVKGLLKTNSLKRLSALAEVFFESTDKFITESGYTIGVFHSQINKLNISYQKNLIPVEVPQSVADFKPGSGDPMPKEIKDMIGKVGKDMNV